MVGKDSGCVYECTQTLKIIAVLSFGVRQQKQNKSEAFLSASRHDRSLIKCCISEAQCCFNKSVSVIYHDAIMGGPEMMDFNKLIGFS